MTVIYWAFAATFLVHSLIIILFEVISSSDRLEAVCIVERLPTSSAK
jgi:hypothetical protein